MIGDGWFQVRRETPMASNDQRSPRTSPVPGALRCRLTSAQRLVQSEAHAFRLSMLDYSAQSLVKSGNVPRVKIAGFVQGKVRTLSIRLLDLPS